MTYDPLPDDRPLAGDAPGGPFLLEGWAKPEDRHTVVCQREIVTAEGRTFRPGDRMTPREAARYGHPVVETGPPAQVEHK